ncbi:MAG: hypothetical protein ACOC4G_11245 [Bacillota bacterium]
MKKCKLMKILLLIFLLIFLINSPWVVERIFARGEVWQVLEFNDNQCFTYEVKRDTQELETSGEITFWVSDTPDEMTRLIAEGNFSNGEFRSSVSVKEKNKEDILANFMATILAESPYEVNEVLIYTIFYIPWLDIPVEKIDLTVGYEEYITDCNEDNYLLAIDKKCKYIGIDGYLIQMKSEVGDINIEMCVNPELPLPLMIVSNSGAEGVFSAELTNYTTNFDIPEWGKSWETAENELMKVVDHFHSNNLQIGKRQPKSYKMIGATAGFGLEVEGGEIELYIFDEENSEEDVLKKLNEASNTGKFHHPSFNKDIPIIINGNKMLIGLEVEYGNFSQTHPAKEEITKVFKTFDSN